MEEITEAIKNLEEEKVLKLVKEKIENNEDPLKILDACKKGMTQIGNESGDTVFLTDLIMAGEIFNEAMELLMPKLTGSKPKSLGKVVIGTVEGDIHNIGKDITINFLKAEGFDVVDLGVDVPAQKFVEAVNEHHPPVLGMSGLLTLSIEPMKKAVDAIKAANLRDKVKIILGGERMDNSVCEYVGGDAWVNDAIDGVKIIKKWVEGEA
jgi:dimethylamine corrinoid protein